MATKLKWTSVGAIVLAGGLLATSLLASKRSTNGNATPAQPHLSIRSTKWDCGTVAQGEIIRATFHIRNDGARRLIVSHPLSSCCGSDGTTEERVVLQPGESHVLRVEIDTAMSCGPTSYSTQYITNDPALPQFVLTVNAHVKGSDEPKGQSNDRTITSPPQMFSRVP